MCHILAIPIFLIHMEWQIFASQMQAVLCYYVPLVDSQVAKSPLHFSNSEPYRKLLKSGDALLHVCSYIK